MSGSIIKYMHDSMRWNVVIVLSLPFYLRSDIPFTPIVKLCYSLLSWKGVFPKAWDRSKHADLFPFDDFVGDIKHNRRPRAAAGFPMFSTSRWVGKESFLRQNIAPGQAQQGWPSNLKKAFLVWNLSLTSIPPMLTEASWCILHLNSHVTATPSRFIPWNRQFRENHTCFP